MESQLRDCAAGALTECLQLKREETLLVVCDPPCFDVGNAFWEAGRQLCHESVMTQISPRKENGNEPPAPVGEWFGQFDVVILPTSKSLTHTQARRDGCSRGARIATLPGISTEVFLRTMQTDWERVGIRTRRIAQQLSSVNTVRITSPAGSELSFKTGGRGAKADDARITAPGDYGNLPGGEAFLAPLEGTAEGVIVIDGSFPLVGLLDEPLRLTVREGRVVAVEGHPCGRQLETLFRSYGESARNIAEFGVGTLDSARISGNLLEDEKVMGTIHIAIGDNASMGGTVKVPVHLDGVVRNPSVWLDGVAWMGDGTVITSRAE